MNMQNKKKTDQQSMRNDEERKHGLSFFISFLVLILSLICIHLCIQQNIYIHKLYYEERKKTWHTFHFRL